MTEENSVDVCVADRQTVRSEDISFLSTAIEEHDRLSARESQLLDRIRRWRQRAVCSEVGIPADELRAELDTYEEDVLLAKSELLSLARSMAGNKARLAMLMGALSRIEDREMAAVKLQMAFRQALSHLFDIKDARSRERRAQQVDALPIFSPTGPPDREGCRLHEHRSGALRVSVHQKQAESRGFNGPPLLSSIDPLKTCITHVLPSHVTTLLLTLPAQIFSPLLEEITGARLYSATCGSGTMGLREFAAAVAYAMGLWYSPEALEDSEDVRKTREVLHCSPPRPARAPGPPTIDAADPFGDSEPSEAGRSAGTSPKETGNGRGGEGDKASPKGRGPAGSGGQVESGDEEEAGGGRGLRESRSRRGQERGKGGGRRERGVSGDSSGEERGGRGKGRDRRESSVSGDSSGDERGERGGRSERSASVASSVESERPRKSDSDVISFEKSIAAVPESVVSVTEDEPCGENSGSSGAGRGRRREGSSAAVKTESESEGGAEAEDGAEATTRETGTQADDGLSAGRNAGEGGDGQWARVNVVDARAERECGEGGDEDWLGCRISVNAYITAPRRKEAKAVTTASATQTQREEVETATQGTQCDAPVAERRAQRERARDGPVAEKPREKSERVMPAVDIWAREEGEGDEGEGRKASSDLADLWARQTSAVLRGEFLRINAGSDISQDTFARYWVSVLQPLGVLHAGSAFEDGAASAWCCPSLLQVFLLNAKETTYRQPTVGLTEVKAIFRKSGLAPLVALDSRAMKATDIELAFKESIYRARKPHPNPLIRETKSARLDYNGFVECIRCLAERRHDSFAGLVELLVSRYLGIDNQGSSMELRWHMARAVIGEGTAATRASVVGCPMAYDEDSNLMTPWRYARVMEGLRVYGEADNARFRDLDRTVRLLEVWAAKWIERGTWESARDAATKTMRRGMNGTAKVDSSWIAVPLVAMKSGRPRLDPFWARLSR